MSKTDVFLKHVFNAASRGTSGFESIRSGLGKPEVFLLPMLVEVSSATWDPSRVRDCQVRSRIGNIVSCLGSLRTVAALEDEPSVISIEASRRGSGPELSRSVPLVKANLVHQPPVSEKGESALIAIIDGGIDVLHESFQDSNGKTRILEIWDQRDSTGPGPTFSGVASYGTIHTEGEINSYIASGTVPVGLGRDTDGHGTHVASIAAGRASGSFAGGMAPEANILVVIPSLQTTSNDPLSLGYSTSHVDALVYVREFANKSGMPVVVNVSQGMNAGAHDGSSLLEAAFDNFSGGGREPGLIVVKSAGNERGHNGHAKLHVLSGSQEVLRWDSQAPHAGPDVIELWFKACDELKFTLRDPKHQKSGLVTRSFDSDSGTFPSGNGYEVSYVQYHHDNGDSRLLVTIWPGSKSTIEIGTWELELQSGHVVVGDIHAWVERDDSRSINFTNHLSDETTLSIPGTAATVIAVGAVAPSKPFKLATYSSYGPTRDQRHKPDVAAPGDGITAAKGGTSNGVRTDAGTSMAAPHVTGAIAIALSHCAKQGQARIPNAAQIRAALSQVAQNFNGNHNPGMGFGVLDVEALLGAFL